MPQYCNRKRAIVTILLVVLPLIITLAQPASAAPNDSTWRFANASNTNNEVVTFADPNLEAAIRQKIGKASGDIHWSDLEGITRLYLGSRGISNLTGLEYCNNLKELHLYQNQIKDLSPLADLIKLQDLHFWDNQISDISPLAELTNLSSLRLQDNQISDISPLSKLTKLKYLVLNNNQISDISPLDGLTNVETLLLKNNQIRDISPLAGLINLEYLNLNDNQIEDISPLVANRGLYEGDKVYLLGNPLNTDSLNTYVHQLHGWGVNVLYDAVPQPTSTPRPKPKPTPTPESEPTPTPIPSSPNVLQPIIWVIIGVAIGVLASIFFFNLRRKH